MNMDTSALDRLAELEQQSGTKKPSPYKYSTPYAPTNPYQSLSPSPSASKPSQNNAGYLSPSPESSATHKRANSWHAPAAAQPAFDVSSLNPYLTAAPAPGSPSEPQEPWSYTKGSRPEKLSHVWPPPAKEVNVSPPKKLSHVWPPPNEETESSPPASSSVPVPIVNPPRLQHPPPVKRPQRPQSVQYPPSASNVSFDSPAPSPSTPPLHPPPQIMRPASSYAPSLTVPSDSPQMVKHRRSPSLGCTMMARPDEQITRKHAFALQRTFHPLMCDFCHKIRTSSKAFVCSICNQTVHSRCVPLVASECTGSSKTSNAPVAFVSSEAKHRGLRALNLTAEAIVRDGWMYKLSRSGKWSRRWFVLVSEEDTFFYFHSKPTSDLLSAVPTGGYPLESSTVTDYTGSAGQGDISYVFLLQHKSLERPVMVGSQSSDDYSQWTLSLQSAIRTCNVIAQAERLDGPQNNRWSGSTTMKVFDPEALSHASVLDPDRGRTLFRSVKCFDGDFCRNQKLFIRLEGLLNCMPEPDAEFFLAVRLYYGGHNVVSQVQTSVSRDPTWSSGWLLLAESISQLPPETVMMISAYKVAKRDQAQRASVMESIKSLIKPDASVDGVTICIGHCHIPLTSYGLLQTGTKNLRLWPGEGSPIHFDFSPAQLVQGSPLLVRVVFPEAPLPIVYGSFPQPWERPIELRVRRDKSIDSVCTRENLELPNPIALLTSAQRMDSWARREQLDGAHLPMILSGCDFTDSRQRMEAKRICEAKAASRGGIPVATAIHLLSGEFSSAHVRAVAAKSLCECVSDAFLTELVSILICGVRFEPFDWNVLSECLIERVKKDASTCHRFFWGLVGNSDLKIPQADRFRFLRKVLQAALSNGEASEFVREHHLCEALCLVSSDEGRKRNLRQLLKPFERFDRSIRLPLSPQYCVDGISLDKSHIMPSNAAPIWIHFVGVDLQLNVIIKSGDDLGQDEFALLFAQLLNSIWSQHQATSKAHVVTYRCLSVLDRVGLIEVVGGCTSIANIQGGTMGAFSKDCIGKYLREQNEKSLNQKFYMDTFVATLAAACVFEYLLGIGDRHGDNILLKRDGSIFHIDFGYLMGCKTMFAGVSREPQPFTFGAAHLAALGGKSGRYYHNFVTLSTECFLEARKSHVFLTGIAMLAAGRKMTNLNKVEDVYWLRDALLIDATTQEAKKHWLKLIDEALSTTRIKFNDAAHNFVQAVKK